jgi:hypothetical protein
MTGTLSLTVGGGQDLQRAAHVQKLHVRESEEFKPCKALAEIEG